MDKDITLEDVHQAIKNVKHPAIDCSLVELGMVKDINVKGSDATFRFLLPFAEIPENVKSHMINSLRESLTGLEVNADIETATMDEAERQYFLAMEKKHWKGL